MVLWKYSFREVASRRGRALMTLASIVIAVAAVVSVSIATSTTRQAYKEMSASISGRASLEITADGGNRFDDDVVAAVGQTPGVTAAVPMLKQLTTMRWRDEPSAPSAAIEVVGIDPAKAKALYDYQIVAGQGLDAGDGVLLESNLAESLGLKPGDSIWLLVSRKGLGLKQETEVLGTVSSESAGTWLTGMCFMPIEQAQDYFAPGQIDMIEIVLDDSADRRTVMEAVARQIPSGLLVAPPQSRTQVVEEQLNSSEMGMKLASAFSLVLAYFMILNTFLMNVGERRRQLSIMRALGATQRQVRRLLYGEALGMGVLGTCLGILVGLGGAYLLNKSLSHLFALSSLPPLQITATPLVLAAIFGLSVSFLGVAVPARRAAKLTPLEGMSRVVREDMEHASHRYTVAGLALTVASGVVLAISIAGFLPTSVAIATAVFLLVGIVLLMPVVLGPFSWLATRTMFFRRPAVAELAFRQVLRHRTRSALTVGVLFVASATGIGLGCTILDNIRDLEKWHTKEIAGDYIVRALLPSAVNSNGTPLPREMGDEIRKIPGVIKVGTACFASGEVQPDASKPDKKVSVAIIVRDFATDAELFLNLVAGQNDEDVRRGLNEGEVVLGTVVAQRNGLHAGDFVTVSSGGNMQRVRIAGLTNEYLNAGLTIHIRRDFAKQYFRIDAIDTFIVVAQPEMLPQVKTQLEAFCKKHGVILQSISEISRLINKMAGGIRACLWGILALGFIVAAFGVVNTLTMNMLEQTREFGLLRAVAMTRRQVRRTILAQAAILACVGLVPGSASGILTAYLINLATMAAVGHPVAFGLHPVMVLGCLVVGFFIVLAAALIPAGRAARLNLLIALQYE